MKVALLTLGTRGDVQPYVVLGKAFKDRGHEVVLSTGRNFASLAREYELPFIPVEADFHALITSPEGREMMKNPFRARRHFRKIVQPMMIDVMHCFYKISANADCVLYHVKTLGDYFADQFPGRMVRANVIPAVQRTHDFPHPVFSALRLPRFLNRFTYALADLGLAMMKPAIRTFRSQAGLSSVISTGTLTEVYGISESFLKMPSDFHGDTIFTGFWFGDSPGQLNKDVTDFLDAAKKTIVLTFGSMPFELHFDLRQALTEIAQELSVKFLIVKGWGFDAVSLSENGSVKVIENAPFDQLFKRVDGVVHHGGIGTLSLCLRAGVPSLSCPIIYPMGDQYFWANRAYQLECGPKPIPLKTLRLDNLKQAISELLTRQQYKDSCVRLAGKLAAEDGPNNAVDFIESKFYSFIHQTK